MMTESPWNLFRRMGCGIRGIICIFVIISITILLLNIRFRDQYKYGDMFNVTQTQSEDTFPLLRVRRGVIIPKVTIYCRLGESPCVAKIDFCDVAPCTQTNQEALTGADKYLCVTRHLNARGGIGAWCEEWGLAGWNTGNYRWGYRPWIAETETCGGRCPSLLERLSIFKPTHEPGCKAGHCNPLIITIKDPCPEDSMTFVLAAYVKGTDPMGHIRLQVSESAPPPITEPNEDSYNTDTPPPTLIDRSNPVQYIKVDSLQDVLELETGYKDNNAWLSWISFTAKGSGLATDCIACAAARPSLGTIPFPLNPHKDLQGYKCMLGLYKTDSPKNNCTTLKYLFPAVSTEIIPPWFIPYEGNYTCLNRRRGISGGQDVGVLRGCETIIEVSRNLYGITDELVIDHNHARSDTWWYCGGDKLRPKLPKLWYGTCALVQLMMPTYLLPMNPQFPKLPPEEMSRVKRNQAIPTSFDTRIYIDSIGVPRGVPDEFKARNQVAAGFESLFAWWVTINKNVDWINYIYYNQQRFINYTRDGFRGIHEQLDKTSLMAWQNRMALDMLLAKEGGVCKIFGNLCCTFIPNNTAPDGSITKALEGLTSLSEELADNSGITDPFTKWMEDMFGKWGNILKVLIMSAGIAMAVLITCGCCCIPCMRELIQRLITTALTKQQLLYQPVSIEDESEEHVVTGGQGDEEEYEKYVQPEHREDLSYASTRDGTPAEDDISVQSLFHSTMMNL